MNALNDESLMIMLFRDKIAEKKLISHQNLHIYPVQIRYILIMMYCQEFNPERIIVSKAYSIFQFIINFWYKRRGKNVQMESQFSSKQSKLLYKRCLDEKYLKPSVMFFMTKNAKKMSINYNFADFSRNPDGTKMVRILLLYIVIFQNQSSSIEYMVKNTSPLW